jgi:hypothetical protein
MFSFQRSVVAVGYGARNAESPWPAMATGGPNQLGLIVGISGDALLLLREPVS